MGITEGDVGSFRRAGYRAVDIIVEHLSAMRERPVFQPMQPEARQALLDQPLPEFGVPPDGILDQFCEQVLPHPMGNGHPRFFGWVNSPPAPIGILAELLAAGMDPSCAGGDHAAIYLERCVVRWLMELVGFPTAGSTGLLVSGGSMASLTCLAAARHWAASCDGWDMRAIGLQEGHRALTVYLSSEGHSCLRKAGELLGLGANAVRTIPIDNQFRMDLPALRAAVAEDRSAGKRPFCVAASAGTVNTGAIDPLNELADFCTAEDLWFHIDGAYGAFAVLDSDRAPCYAGMERAHSLALDPHKWLSVPVECGCALVRDGKLLREAFSLVPPYLRTEEGKGFGGLPWFSEYGFQQTRGFRALKLWMVLQQAGRDGVRGNVSRHIALARYLAALIDDDAELERLAPVELSIVCFRYVPADLRGNDTAIDALNKTILEQLQAGGEVFLSSTVLNSRFALRACVLHYATKKEDIDALVAIVRRVGARCAEEVSQKA